MAALRTACLCALLIALATRAEGQLLRMHHPVTFGSRAGQDADSDSVVHVYMDREGSLYPESRVPVRDRDLAKRDSRLYRYFLELPEEWERLRTTLGLAGGQLNPDRWDQAQDAIRARLVRRITGRARNGRSPVLFLVHGFRVESAQDAYTYAMRSVAVQVPGVRPVYVHVNWDGQHAPLLFAMGAWKEANRNAPLVGLQFRRLVARLPDGLPVRILTHSLGGSVVASALWTRSDLPVGEHASYATYGRLAAEYQRFPLPPNPDIRVGMVVPAMPGRSFASVLPTARSAGNYSAMIVGQNPHDIVVAKGYVNPRLLGSTALAVELSEFCRHVYPIYQADARAAGQVVNFELPNQSDMDHAFERYFDRKPMREFLDLLLLRPNPQLADTEACTKARRR